MEDKDLNSFEKIEISPDLEEVITRLKLEIRKVESQVWYSLKHVVRALYCIAFFLTCELVINVIKLIA